MCDDVCVVVCFSWVYGELDGLVDVVGECCGH